MACNGLKKGAFHLFVCTPYGIGSFLEQHISGPFLTHFLSQQNSFSRLSALRERERHARTEGQPNWVKLGDAVPESPRTQRDRPAYTVGTPKQAVKPGKQGELAAKKQLVLPREKHFESSASKSDSDSDVDSDAEKSDKSNKSHKGDKSDQISASEHTRDLPDLPIPQSSNWM